MSRKNITLALLIEIIAGLSLAIALILMTKAPNSPLDIKVDAATYDSISLSWNDSDDADGYRIYRSKAGDGNYEYLGTTTDAKYNDNNLRTGDAYSYRIRPYNGAKNGQVSDISDVETVLDAPEIKSSTDGGVVTITASEIPGAYGYELYRNGEAVTKQEDPVFVDSGTEDDVEYTYTIKAYRYDADPVFSLASNETKVKIIGIGEIEAEAFTDFLEVTWKANTHYAKYEIYRDDEKLDTVTEGLYRDEKFEVDKESTYTIKGITEDDEEGIIRTRKMKVTSHPFTNEEAIDAACKWAIDIANDDSFEYGTGERAHRGGCYFCQTNVGPRLNKKGKEKVKDSNGVWHSYEKTYCCNPYVHAAYAHGAGDENMLAACRRGSAINMSEQSFTRYGNWKNVGKPAMKDLHKGDVLVRGNHVSMYVGDGQGAEASGGKWGPDSIHTFEMTQKYYNQFKFVMRYTGTGSGTGYDVEYV